MRINIEGRWTDMGAGNRKRFLEGLDIEDDSNLPRLRDTIKMILKDPEFSYGHVEIKDIWEG